MKKFFVLLFLASIFVGPAFCQLSSVTLHYYGTFSLKIISEKGWGDVLLGLNDTIDNSYPRTCTLKAQRNSDLVIDLVVLDDAIPGIWPRAKICKHIGARDSIIEIMDYDIDMLALYETASAKITMAAPDYKVSIGDAKILKPRTLPFPIGESYLQLSFLDQKGALHQDVLLPVSVPETGGNIIITPEKLAQGIKLN